MSPLLRIVSPGVARRAIASAYKESLSLGKPALASRLGSVTLDDHQLLAVRRLRVAMDEFGGAMLADPVGTGKTYVALAIASERQRPLVAAPAVLRGMWCGAAHSAGQEIAFVSLEALSRGAALTRDHDLLVVDEAHHVRNPATRRHAAVAQLAASAPVLLLTATPVHNRRRDLDSLLALFLGQRAAALTDAEIARCVLRRDCTASEHVSGRPRLGRFVWCEIPADSSVPARLLALPPPLPPSDGGDGGALVVYSLVRRWASSDAALAGALRRRLHRSIGLAAALEGGSYPSRAELEAWNGCEDVVQLALPGLIGSPASDTHDLLRSVRAHADAVSSLLRGLCGLRGLRGESASDRARAEVIRGIRARHAGLPVVAFSQFADTVHGLFALLARDGRVAALSGRGAKVAGGTISRTDAIARFAPLASGRPPPDAAHSVTLLLTTDLLSEGVNLQDAGAVVHLDLPWTAARMEQRIGRIVRFGSPHAEVFEYGLRPPAGAESLARIEALLLEKVEAAGIIVRPIIPVGGHPRTRAPVPSTVEATLARIASWNSCAEDPAEPGQPCRSGVIAAVRSPRRGFIAIAHEGDRISLIGALGGRISDDPKLVSECARIAEGAAVVLDPRLAEEEMDRLTAWLNARSALGDSSPGDHHSVRTALKRLAAALARCRPHARVSVAAKAAAARAVLGSRLGSHLEEKLDLLNRAKMTDADWLDAVCALRPDQRSGNGEDRRSRPVAMIVLLPPSVALRRFAQQNDDAGL